MRIKIALLLGVACIVLASYTNGEGPHLNQVKVYKGTYDEVLRESKKLKKPVVLEFWASWCGPCRKMDNETFAQPAFAKYLNENFLFYKVDIDSFDGMEIADRFAIDAYPTLVVLDAKNKYINRYRGFFPPDYLKNELEKSKKQKGKRFITPKSTVASF